MTPRIGSLCSGYGGLDQGVQSVLDGRTAWVSDIDKGANKILAHRYPDVPNLGDFTVTDWSTVEPVEVLTAGFPCQPVSHAGKRLGDNDERWLWDDVARAVCELRPGLVVLENVRGLLTAGGGRLFGRVVGTLAGLGYDAQWHGLRAADVGAPHGRWRVFITANPSSQRHGARQDAGSLGRMGRKDEGRSWEWQRSRAVAGDRADQVALPNAGITGLQGVSVGTGDPGTAAAGSDQGVVDWRGYTDAVRRWERILGRPAPAPSVDGKENPAFVEWMLGLPAGWVTDVPGITRNEALKALGNGVVPQQAEAALRAMLTHLEVAA